MHVRKKLIAIPAALLLAGGALFGGTAAYADDVVPPVDAPVVEIAPEVVPEETPVETPVEVAEEARVESFSVVKVTICHKPGTPAEQETKEVPESAVEGHLGHGDTLGACLVEADTTPYRLFAWVVADLNDIWAVPQTFKTSIDLEEGNLNALDDQLTQCGVDYQVDLYYDDEAAENLETVGELYGPNNPTEHLAYDAVKGNPWKFIDNPNCVVINKTCEVYTDNGTATQLNANGWVPFDTRPKGHAVFVENGLHIYSDAAAGESPDQRKLQWQKDVADFPLSEVGQFDADYDATSGTSPGVKVVVEFTPGVFGTLIWEQIYDVAGEQDLWLPESANAAITAPDNGGGYGSTRHGTVNEWLTVYPDAVVVAIQFGNGSGVDFDGVLHSVSAGCATDHFDKVDIPVSIQFNVEAPTAQCGVAGELPNLGELPEGVTRTVTGGDGGPGVYTITFAALLGYVINGQSVFEIVVPEALDYQNENNEAPCFVEPKQNEIVNGQAPCGVATYPITTTVFTLDPATGEYDDGVATVTQGQVKEVQLCEGLAFTGVNTPGFIWAGVIFALLVGTTMVLVPVGNRRGWFNQA